jgi:predicted RNA-binding Zn-ribbon protein involved in translation (DUF1610 family)
MAQIIGKDGIGNPAKPKTALEQSTPMECKNCGYDTYVPAIKMRRLSKLLSGKSKDDIIPIEVYLCGNCGEVSEELYPEELKKLIL